MTGLSANIANISQRMIAEDFEMIPVVRSNQTLLGVITRRDIMEKMSRAQISSLPTFSEQVGQKISRQDDVFSFTVEPFMLDQNGVLANGVLTEIITRITQQMMSNRGRSLIIDQMMMYFFQAVQIDDLLHVQPQIIRQTRRTAIIDFDMLLGTNLVSKATITVKIN
jgi:hypothetical protein